MLEVDAQLVKELLTICKLATGQFQQKALYVFDVASGQIILSPGNPFFYRQVVGWLHQGQNCMPSYPQLEILYEIFEFLYQLVFVISPYHMILNLMTNVAMLERTRCPTKQSVFDQCLNFSLETK